MPPFVGVARPLRGMRLGVMTTVGSLVEGIFGGVEPKTLAIGDEFHRGRAWMGINPPVPVPSGVAEGGLSPIGGRIRARGVKNGIWSRDCLEEDEVEVVVVAVDTERFRGVGVVKRLSLRCVGNEVTLAPDRIEDPREELWPVGDIAPWVKVELLDVLPDERGLCSVTILRFLTGPDISVTSSLSAPGSSRASSIFRI